jgi:hypothetical protein
MRVHGGGRPLQRLDDSRVKPSREGVVGVDLGLD